jgi:hypothetical protein
MNTAKEFYYHSVANLKGRCSAEGEAIIAQDAMFAAAYARDVIKGPFPEAEPVIAQSGIYSLTYAIETLKAPFPAGEAAIAMESESRQQTYRNEFKDLPKAEKQKGLVFEIDMSDLDSLMNEKS